MNYGLIRLDCFHEVGGLEEAYQFYCADSDLCYKLYEKGKQFIPLSGCFVTHDNLDARKATDVSACDKDIELLLQRWKHFVSIELPNPRRLFRQEDLHVKNNLVGLIFSKDRALQLQAALESFFLHCTDSGRIKLYVKTEVGN